MIPITPIQHALQTEQPQTNNPYPLAILKSFQSVILNINSKSRFQTKNCDLHHHQSHTYFYPKQHQKQTTYLAGALNHKTAHNKGKNVSISRSRQPIIMPTTPMNPASPLAKQPQTIYPSIIHDYHGLFQSVNKCNTYLKTKQ